MTIASQILSEPLGQVTDEYERVTVPEFGQVIIEQLFMVGLNLSAADVLIKDARARELLLSTIASLDETIRWISASAFKVIAEDPNAHIDE